MSDTPKQTDTNINETAIRETKKRVALIKDFMAALNHDHIEGIILVGSLAYGANSNVKENSDIDIIVCYDDIKNCAKDYFDEAHYLLGESYDGYLVKRHANAGHVPYIRDKNEDKINISIHNINYSALQRISYGNYETLAYYRQSQKSSSYLMRDFDGNEYPYKPTCEQVRGVTGERRIDCVAFPSDGSHYTIGNDMDKLLSNAKVLYDKSGKMHRIMINLWENVAKKIIRHRSSNHQSIIASNEDIGPLLYRYNRFSEKAKALTKERTVTAISAVLQGYSLESYIEKSAQNKQTPLLWYQNTHDGRQ